MNKLILELWHDLRAKRLWPVAALLVAALVAVPVMLKKNSSTPPAPTPPAASASSAGDNSKAVVVADTGTAQGSTLGVFNKKDPFKPDKAVLSAAHPKPTPAPKSPSQPAGGGSTPSGGNGSGSGSGSGNGNGGGVPVTPQPTKPQAPKGPFAYTVDVKFGKRGETRVHHDVQKLDVLPNQNNPLLVFLGVNTAGDTAVFLTDTSLKAAGEGTCKPNGDTCSFLYLKLDKNSNTEDLSEVVADGSGTEYTLTLLAIHKVLVSELAKGAKKAAAAARAEARRAHIEKHKSPTAFHVPLSAQLTPDTVG
ncbi:MAG: hypothetical protein AUG48_08350 [Actinobacteria bacterium 13_1_20CM_3_68_9]|nr:MAG: hypothetical protein AUG48_08350 [Actinobacteria bacterium 13_1_20CM_3_68_9]